MITRSTASTSCCRGTAPPSQPLAPRQNDGNRHHVSTIDHGAKMLGEDQELLEAIVYNDDNMTYGNIVSVDTGTDEPITKLTDDGISEIKDMLASARQSNRDWHDFQRHFVADPHIIARVKDLPLR